jgi:hypothetical protein
MKTNKKYLSGLLKTSIVYSFIMLAVYFINEFYRDKTIPEIVTDNIFMILIGSAFGAISNIFRWKIKDQYKKSDK